MSMSHFCKQFNIGKSRTAGGESGGSLDIIGTCARYDLTHFDLLFVCQQTGFDDYFQDFLPAHFF